jgi:hypothetical protein
MVEPGMGRIHFVATHYSTLRGGVSRAVLAPCLLAIMVIHIVVNDRVSGPLAALISIFNLFLMAALGLALMFRCRRWLDARFGRVCSTNPFLPDIGLLVGQVGFFAFSRLDDFYGVGSGYPSSTFLFVAAVGLWFCVRLRPHSLHYAVPTLVALGFALQRATVTGDQAIELWETKALVTSLLAWAAAGLIDLAMLFKFLPPQAEAEAVSVDA